MYEVCKLKAVFKTDINDFDAFDIGQHYLKLQEVGTKDEEIGGALRRFVEDFAPLVAGEKSVIYGVKCESIRKEENESGFLLE